MLTTEKLPYYNSLEVLLPAPLLWMKQMIWMKYDEKNKVAVTFGTYPLKKQLNMDNLKYLFLQVRLLVLGSHFSWLKGSYKQQNSYLISQCFFVVLGKGLSV